MTVKVWHLDDKAFASAMEQKTPPAQYLNAKMGFRDDGSQEAACGALFAHGKYRLAAEVPNSDLDGAWESTNHIDQDWTKTGRALASLGPQRSSCVGDLFETIQEDGASQFHVCASIGWKPVNLQLLGLGTCAPKKPKR